MEEVPIGQNTFIPKVSINVAEERKKPRLEAMLFVEYATRTDKGTYIFAGGFSRLFFSKAEKRVTSKFYLYVQTGETRCGDLQIAIFNPNDELHLAIKFDIKEHEFSPKYPVQIHLLQIIQFPVPVEGNYWFDVSCDGKSLGGQALIVEFEKEEEAQKDEHESGVTQKHD